MIFDLPKNYRRGDVPLFNRKKPVMKLTPIIKGVLLYELNKLSLIGQIFFSKGVATVSIAESKTFIVKRSGRTVAIEPDEGQDFAYKYEVFGNCDKYEYTVYEYAKGVVQPTVSVQVTQDPLQDECYSVFIDDSVNAVRNLLIVAAINGLVQGV